MTNIYQRIFDADIKEGSGIRAVLKGEESYAKNGYIVINESVKEPSPGGLLSDVNIPPEKQKSYDLAAALFDNYDLLSSVRDDITPEENEEIDELLEYIVDRAPMRIARDYISEVTGRKFTDPSWYAFVRETWFRPFAIEETPTCTGFEHVFLGEWYASNNSVGGVHWWYFYLQKSQKIDYKAAKYNNTASGLCTPQVATMNYFWKIGERTIEKKVGGFFVGPSVEGLMAMGMVRGYAESAATNMAIIDGAEIELRLYKSPDGRSFVTFYPILKRVLCSMVLPSATGSAESSGKSASGDTQNPANGNGDAEVIVDGPIRLVSAMANPEGDDAGKENVTMMNMHGSGAANLRGWRVVGPNKSFIEFGDVELEVGSTQTFVLPASGSLQLSNKGGEIRVLNAEGGIVQKVRYDRSSARVKGAVLFWDGDASLVVKEATS